MRRSPLQPVREIVIKREVKFLLNLRGGINIISLYDTLEDPVTHQVVGLLEMELACRFVLGSFGNKWGGEGCHKG